jgi:hypothetical protein
MVIDAVMNATGAPESEEGYARRQIRVWWRRSWRKKEAVYGTGRVDASAKKRG